MLQISDCSDADLEKMNKDYGLMGIVLANLTVDDSADAILHIQYDDEKHSRKKQELIDARCEYNTQVS